MRLKVMNPVRYSITTFFTNEACALLDRFKKRLNHVEYSDVLVGLNDDKIKTF
jgi:hypothetical protein